VRVLAKGQVTSIYISKDLLKLVDKVAEKMGVSRSFVVKQAVTNYLMSLGMLSTHMKGEEE